MIFYPYLVQFAFIEIMTIFEKKPKTKAFSYQRGLLIPR